ncbi:MAG: hemolysin III family protein [Pseudomonadota bacterium]
MTDAKVPARAPSQKPAYTAAELMADRVLHMTGVGVAVIAAPVLVGLAAAWHGQGATLTAVAVYAVCLVAMFAASACYHLIEIPRLTDWLRRLDHAAIYAKIAGTYTPFTVMLGGERTVVILAGMWSAAGAGIALKLLAPRHLQWLALGLYLAMGWAILAVGGPILAALGTPALVLLFVGGALYTAGVVFHLWDGLPFQNVIWHAAVLAASFVFYTAVLLEVVRAPA